MTKEEQFSNTNKHKNLHISTLYTFMRSFLSHWCTSSRAATEHKWNVLNKKSPQTNVYEVLPTCQNNCVWWHTWMA